MITQWVNIFKLLGNENRLNILKLLTAHRELSVRKISRTLDIREKLVSQHLVLLAHANFVIGKGKLGSVYYSFHPALRNEVLHILQKFVK